MSHTPNDHSRYVLDAEADETHGCDATEPEFPILGITVSSAARTRDRSQAARRSLPHVAPTVPDKSLVCGSTEQRLSRRTKIPPEVIFSILNGDSSSEGATSDGVAHAARHPVSRIRDLVESEHQAERLAAVGEVVASVGHESRNALQRIKARVELMRLDAAGNAKLLHNLDEIQKAGNELECMFEELREYCANISLHPTPSHCRELVQEAWESVRERPEMRDVHLQLEMSDRVVMVDPVRMKQVFRNLVENAAGANATQIEVVAHDAIVCGEQVTKITFRDDGPGFSGQQLEKAFKPFFTTKKRGTGLGLPICKRIIEQHSGRIEIDPNAPTGATIVITLINLENGRS